MENIPHHAHPHARPLSRNSMRTMRATAKGTRGAWVYFLSLVVVLAMVSSTGSSTRNMCPQANQSTVLVVYDTRENHTQQLAMALARGVNMSLSIARVIKANEAAPEDVLSSAGLALGSPVYFGNPSSVTLAFVERCLGSTWEDRSLAGRPGAVFATGGGIHQGTESTLFALTRSLLAFGYRMFTPDMTPSGFVGVAGVTAVTGTEPFSGATIDSRFAQAAETFGLHLGGAAASYWREVCNEEVSSKQ